MTRRLAAFIVLLPFVLAPATRAQGPSGPGTPDASWARLNGRVLDGVTGKPATDVPVLLQCSWSNGQWGHLEGATDANGQFSIGTPAGQCTLALNIRQGASAEGPALRLFEFAPGETVETIRKLEHFPVPQPLEGRVLDDRGEPVGGVRVILRQSMIRAGTRQWTAWPPVKTDASGAFRFPSIYTGSWEVVVPSLGLSRVLEVASSASTSRPPAPIIIRGARVAAFRVSGRVESPPGKSRHFALVYLDRADSPRESPLSIAETASDDSGNFTFAEVPAGAYRIRIDTSPTRPGSPRMAPAEVFWAMTPVVVNGDVTGVVVTARPGAELRAEVRLDDPPSALNRALLLVSPADGKFLPNILALDGYLITPLVPGRYRIRTTGIPSGYRIKSVTIGGRDVTEDGFDLGDAPINNMIVTLTKQFTELKGVVKDAQDRPDGEAAVLAFPTNRRLWTNTGQIPAFMGNAHVSQKGNYSVKGLPAGEYFVVATFSDPMLTTDAETLERLAPFAERVRLADGQTMTLNLQTKN
jgi:hypothetical protein